MEQLALYVPKLDELWFRQKMLSDPDTMGYNANWDVTYSGYHRDTGCIGFPEPVWAGWYERWIGREPERFYAYIRRSSDGAWIGEVDFRYMPEQDWWDMGIVICAQYREMGYATPALRLLLEHAFCDCGVRRLHNEFEFARPRALSVHLAAGFRETGVRDGLRHLLLTKEEYLLRQREGDGYDYAGKRKNNPSVV